MVEVESCGSKASQCSIGILPSTTMGKKSKSTPNAAASSSNPSSPAASVRSQGAKPVVPVHVPVKRQKSPLRELWLWYSYALRITSAAHVDLIL